jgi:hypothetical protein
LFKISKRVLRILDFDTECRPMHYNEWRPESQITAIAWSWVGATKISVSYLSQNVEDERDMLLRFLKAYDEADMVSGHYIRKHDLPLLNDHALRVLGRPIGSKLTQDTMVDLKAIKSLGKSQDNLAATFSMLEEKHHMTGADWREANKLTTVGIEKTVKRVSDDVIQHKALTAELLHANALHSPRVWYP